MTPLEIFNEILFWVTWYVLLWNGYFLLFNKGVPNIKTSTAIRKHIISLIEQDIANKNQDTYTIVDLGCGNGKFSRQLAKKFPDATIIGIEIAHLSHWRCTFLKHIQRYKNLTHIRCDFMEYDLSNVDATLIYLTIFQMDELGKKLKKEAKPNALITSNRFALGAGWIPEKVEKIGTAAINQGDLHIYKG